MRIGYIGLGLMGAPCAAHVQKHYPLSVWARNSEACQPFIAAGATQCSTPAELAEQVDLLFINVTDSADVESLLFGADGIASSGKKGLVVIDMSTISAVKTKEFALKLDAIGIEFADAPVSGGTAGAQAGTLTFMVGAKKAIFEKIYPALACMGSKITRIGEPGAGQVAKSCNQICITANILGLAEAVLFAQKNEVDFTPIREALLGGFAASKVLEIHGNRLLQNDFSPGFKSSLHLKDMRIIREIADAKHVSLPLAQLGLTLLELAVANGRHDDDSSIIGTLLHHITDTRASTE